MPHGRLFLAPMAGYTDAPMRRICRAMGADAVFSEMADAAGVARGSFGSLQLLDTLPGETPVFSHLFGNDPTMLAEACARVDAAGGFAGIDLNAGCPVRRILAKRSGAALMRDPDHLFEILVAMRRATRLPISLKTRIGWETAGDCIRPIVEAAVAAGVAMLTVHARPVSRGHGGPADLAQLARVREYCPIPLVGNGGIVDPDAAMIMRERAGVDGWMIGRAAMGNPWIFRWLRAGLDGAQSQLPTVADRLAMLDRHLTLQRAFARRQARRYGVSARRLNPEQLAVMRFRAHLFRYVHGVRGAPRLRAELNRMFTIADVQRAVGEHIAVTDGAPKEVPHTNSRTPGTSRRAEVRDSSSSRDFNQTAR